MIFDHLIIRDECGNTTARIAHGPDGWDWRCSGCSTAAGAPVPPRCSGCSSAAAGFVGSGGFLSASAALADFESHVERRHP